MFKSYFDSYQIILITLSGLSLLISLSLFKSKPFYSSLLLFFAALFIFFFGATLDDFYNLWDERFHALVAKNLTNNPFKPLLYPQKILDLDYVNNWSSSYIWLHKQPLFLWQAALSFKIFGVSPLAYRIPSVVLGSFSVLASYKIATALINRRTGYFVGVLMISSQFLLELIAGSQSLGQNDISFVAYITFSIWSFIKYQQTKSAKWLVLIGLFSGLAILTKWLVGLFIYLTWFIFILYSKEFKQLKELSKALLITALVFVPWQIFCYWNYREEFITELTYNSQHFFETLEGHGGSYLFYLESFSTLFGTASTLLFGIGVVFLIKNRVNFKFTTPLLLSVLFVYLFFSVAETKMIAFPLICQAIVFMVIAYVLNELTRYLEKFLSNKILKSIPFFLIVIGLILIRFNIEHLQAHHTNWRGGALNHNIQTFYKDVFKNAKLQNNDVLFNAGHYHYVEAMLHTDNIAYGFIPTKEQLHELNDKGYNAVLLSETNHKFPDYIINSEIVRIIDNSVYVVD